jgi:F-type H+-transporting ATPase subunit b
MNVLGLAESIQLVPDGTIFLHIFIILGMVFVLNQILYRPINRILNEREGRTRGRSGEAHEIIRRVGESLQRYENSLRQARAESYRLLEQQQAAASDERARKVDGVRKEVEEQIEEQKREIGVQAEAARRTLLNEAAQVAVNIKSQTLHR